MSDVDEMLGDWTDAENDLIVADYLDMLRLELSGQSYVKSQRNAALREIVKRSRSSVLRSGTSSLQR